MVKVKRIIIKGYFILIINGSPLKRRIYVPKQELCNDQYRLVLVPKLLLGDNRLKYLLFGVVS
jgi:hypothetical protein